MGDGQRKKAIEDGNAQKDKQWLTRQINAITSTYQVEVKALALWVRRQEKECLMRDNLVKICPRLRGNNKFYPGLYWMLLLFSPERYLWWRQRVGWVSLAIRGWNRWSGACEIGHGCPVGVLQGDDFPLPCKSVWLYWMRNFKPQPEKSFAKYHLHLKSQNINM